MQNAGVSTDQVAESDESLEFGQVSQLVSWPRVEADEGRDGVGRLQCQREQSIFKVWLDRAAEGWHNYEVGRSEVLRAPWHSTEMRDFCIVGC